MLSFLQFLKNAIVRTARQGLHAHARATPTVATAGGFQALKRWIPARTWIMYFAFSDSGGNVVTPDHHSLGAHSKNRKPWLRQVLLLPRHPVAPLQIWRRFLD